MSDLLADFSRALNASPVQFAVAVYLGLLAGGYATVLAARVHDAGPGLRALLTASALPASSCPACGRRLAWRDKAPVVGWVLCRGRCRGCGTGVPAAYPVTECAVALFVVAFAAPGLGDVEFWWRLAGGLAGATTVACAAAGAPSAGRAAGAVAVLGIVASGATGAWSVSAADAGLTALAGLALAAGRGRSAAPATAALALAPWAGWAVAAAAWIGGFAAEALQARVARGMLRPADRPETAASEGALKPLASTASAPWRPRPLGPGACGRRSGIRPR